MKKSFVQLQELFSELNKCAGSCSHDVNPCGECNACCRSHTMEFHKVSPLEFDYLEEMVGKFKTDLFREYIKRLRDVDGNLLHEVCPNYSDGGCTVHDYRPYSCRMYGVYRTDKEIIPDYCVFNDVALVVPHEERLELLPGNRALQRLLMDYLLEEGSADDLTEIEFDEENADLPSLAAYYMSQGQQDKAIPLLEFLIQDRPDEHLHIWQMAEAYEAVGRQDEALQYFYRAAAMAPTNAHYQAELANCLFRVGRAEEAVPHYKAASELNPKRALVHGMLGICHMNAGRDDEAEECFRVTLGKEQEPTIFRYQFALLCYRQGRKQDARELFELALECPYTQVEAERAISTMF